MPEEAAGAELAALASDTAAAGIGADADAGVGFTVTTAKEVGSTKNSITNESLDDPGARLAADGALTSRKPGNDPSCCKREEALAVCPTNVTLLPCSLKTCKKVSSGNAVVSVSMTRSGSMRAESSSDNVLSFSADCNSESLFCTTGLVR